MWAASPTSYAENSYATPKEMTIQEIRDFVKAFQDAARRSVEAGFDVIEIHGAHGYLFTQFLSPITNQRTDEYGGSFDNRVKLLFEVIAAVGEVIPPTTSLFLRISATEWMEHADGPSWTLEDTIRLAKMLPGTGIDLLDVSSGGNNAAQKINVHPYYQINLASQVREALRKDDLSLLIGAVGMITTAEMARDIVQEGDGQVPKADLVLIGRQFLREPEFPLRAAHQLGVEVHWPNQYHRAGWAKNTKI